MSEFDLGDLSVKELNDLMANAKSLVDAKEQEEIAKCRDDVMTMITERGFTFEQVFGSKGKAPKVVKPAPYQDDKGQTWMGKGRKPVWLIERLNSGSKLEDFLVKS